MSVLKSASDCKTLIPLEIAGSVRLCFFLQGHAEEQLREQGFPQSLIVDSVATSMSKHILGVATVLLLQS